MGEVLTFLLRIRRYYGELTGTYKPDIDTKAIAQNHERINIAIEQAALKVTNLA